LRKRRRDIFRLVPVSPDLLDTIGLVSVVRGIREAQRKRNVQAQPR
jgi:hypothetical protein